jgi:hypothetical protein
VPFPVSLVKKMFISHIFIITPIALSIHYMCANLSEHEVCSQEYYPSQTLFSPENFTYFQRPLDVNPVLTDIYFALPYYKSSSFEVSLGKTVYLSESSAVSPGIIPKNIVPCTLLLRGILFLILIGIKFKW